MYATYNEEGVILSIMMTNAVLSAKDKEFPRLLDVSGRYVDPDKMRVNVETKRLIGLKNGSV